MGDGSLYLQLSIEDLGVLETYLVYGLDLVNGQYVMVDDATGEEIVMAYVAAY